MTEPLSNVFVKSRNLQGLVDESTCCTVSTFEVRQSESVSSPWRNGARQDIYPFGHHGILAKRAPGIDHL